MTEPPDFFILFLSSESIVATIPLWIFTYETMALSTDLPDILIFLKLLVNCKASDAEVFF